MISPWNLFSPRSNGVRVSLALPLLLAWTFANQAQDQNPAVTFEKRLNAAVTEGFPRWDTDQDGYLTLRETTRALSKPENKGDGAAALATLHELLRGTRWRLNAITMQQIQEPARRPLDLPNWAAIFSRMAAAVESSSSEIFMNGAPRLEGIKQGREGDCFLLAVLGAQLNKDPNLVKGMITPLSGGAEINFNGVKAKVPNLTDAERALAANSGDQGTWLSLVEKGWGRVELELRRDRFNNPLEGLANGGDPAQVIRVLTGRKTISRQLLIEDGIGDVIKDLDYSLRMAKEDKRIACAGTDGRRLPPGFIPRHAFAILDYNPRTRLITMWNPWGLDRPSSGEPSLQNGYPTKGGKFEIPINDFVRVFDRIFIESASKVNDD